MTAWDDAIFNYYSMINQKFVTKMCLTILLPINPEIWIISASKSRVNI